MKFRFGGFYFLRLEKAKKVQIYLFYNRTSIDINSNYKKKKTMTNINIIKNYGRFFQ